MTWTIERNELLRHLWNAEGRSASECAEALGVSRNAVIGRARRMKLDARQSPIIRGAVSMSADARYQRAWKARRQLQAEKEAEMKRQSFPSSDCCLFAKGSRTPYEWCCEPVAAPGAPYCARHMRLCYEPARPMATPLQRAA